MSVIQSIRNKYIGLVVGAIVIALIGFLVMDAMQSNTRGLFGTDQTLLADVNGNRIDYKKYEERRLQYEENMMSRSKEGKLSEEERKQARESAYTDMVNDILLDEEINKLGLGLTDAELKDMLYGQFVDPMIKQSFIDKNTGQFDPNMVSQQLSGLGQDKTGQARVQWERFQNEIIKNKIKAKYTDMIAKGIYIPKFVFDKEQTAKHTIASVNYVSIPYTSINDSSIKVSDEEIKTYLEKNSVIYKEKEDKAKAEYVVFDILASSEDTASSLGKLNAIREEFLNTTDNEGFVGNNSDEAFSKTYYTESKIEMPNPMEVIAQPVGGVVGPVFINGSFKMVKVLDKKQMPDSAKASHILIKINEQRNEETAKKIIDSLETAVKAGAPMDMLAAQMSEDDGSKIKGGDLGYFGPGMMVPEFNDACFDGKTGDLKVVKTQFGYHLIKVTDQKDFKPAVQLAVVSKLLQVGTQTSNLVYAKANEFAKVAKDATSFNEAAKKFGKDKRVAEGMTKIQTDVQGLGEARTLTRWAFDAKIGDVSQVINLTDKCVIALLSSRTAKGSLPAVNDVRQQIEYIVKRDKKAEMIAAKYKSMNTIEAISQAAAVGVITLDTVKVGGSNELGYENRVLGACFNKANVNKFTGPITGEQGVFYIFLKGVRVDEVAMKMLPAEMERQQMVQQMAGQISNAVPYILKLKAKMKIIEVTSFN